MADLHVPAVQVIQRLCDVVSKNGNLLLSIPMRGDGTIDAEEEKVLDGITGWMSVNGEAAIWGSRPWRIYGEGPTQVRAGMHTEGGVRFTARDVRFTVKDRRLNAILLAWPDEPVVIAALGTRAGAVASARLADGRPVRFRQSTAGLQLVLPPPRVGEVAPVVILEGRGLA